MFSKHFTRRITCASHLLASIALLLTGASRVSAQDSLAQHTPWMVGASVGLLGTGSQASPLEFGIVGVNFTQRRPGHPGADIAVGTMPRALAAGVVPIAVRAGVALPVAAAPGLLLLPSAGFSVLGVTSGYGSGGAAGWNVGGAAVLGTGSTGVRVGLTSHWMSGGNSAVWLLEVGLVGLPEAAR